MKGYEFRPDMQKSDLKEGRLGLKYNPDMRNSINHNLGENYWGRLTKAEQKKLKEYWNWLQNQFSKEESSDKTISPYFKQGAGIAMGVTMLYALGSIFGAYGGKDDDKKIPDLANVDYNTLSNTAMQALLLEVVHQQVLDSEKPQNLVLAQMGGASYSPQGNLDYAIAQAKTDGKIDANEVKYLTDVAMNPSDLKAIIDESERIKFEQLYNEVESGKIQAVNDENTDTEFELKNLANTQYYHGNINIGNVFNPDEMMVDLKGVTVIYPNIIYFAQARKTIFYQQLEAASLHIGLTADAVHIRSSGGESGAMDFNTAHNSPEGPEAKELINKRLIEWNNRYGGKGVAQTPVTSVNKSSYWTIETVPQTSKKFYIYHDPSGSVAISPVE